MAEPFAVVSTALVLAVTAVVLGVSGQRAERRPRHAGGSGPAARRAAVLRTERLAGADPPTVELIAWPAVDPDRYWRSRCAASPPAGEDPTLALLRRVRDGLREL
ncbi:hypothetical protein FHR84_002591 [Actinopolyspora biskrensis]|uniref:Uncharacterized protein n=1 Tax=Actinopolyspora biskrensis TaxID=1470178 RepID=A0A852Z9N7_9ACTN|nr:hypothetical protein [Actinopolyspora biskrensis]NYH79257.1 hypothetical protein [Actinopolyspora biskrensis]